jgi:hypothetical protein
MMGNNPELERQVRRLREGKSRREPLAILNADKIEQSKQVFESRYKAVLASANADLSETLIKDAAVKTASVQLLATIVRKVGHAVWDFEIIGEHADTVTVKLDHLPLSGLLLEEFLGAARVFPDSDGTTGIWPGEETVDALKVLLRPYQTEGGLPADIQIVAECDVQKPRSRRPKGPMLGWSKNSPWRHYLYPYHWGYSAIVPFPT